MADRKQNQKVSNKSVRNGAIVDEAIRPMVEDLESRTLLAFVHPGILSTDADFTRMATKVAANAQPWMDGWNKLLSNGWAHLGMQPGPVATITRGDTNNSSIMWSQIAQCTNSALIWKVTGDTRYADQAVSFLNAWATVNTTVNGNSNAALALGLYGFQWANVAEIMRTYSGWTQTDQTQFKNYLLSVFSPGIHNYLGLPPYTQHWGADPSHYWANWDLCNIGALMAIGVFTDRQDLYDEALNYVYTGVGNGAFDKAIYYLHAGNLGQNQEAGRDMGHATLNLALLGQICQMAWNQGDDLFGYKNNLVLANVEYLAKYNLGNNVPYTTYASETSGGLQTVVAGPQGFFRPVFELFYNHYVMLEGLSAPYTSQALAQKTRPEGDYGNGDEYSWGTLLFALDPDTVVHVPQNLVGYQKGTGNIELSWWGGANDTSFNVYRANSAAGPFTQVASGILPTYTSHTDKNLPAGTYYYKVTGVSGSTETAPTNVFAATSGTPILSQLNFNESAGTTASDSVGTLTGTLNGGAAFVAGGKSGNALSLDGTNGYLKLPAGAIANLADYTIATWVNLNVSQTWARIFDFGDTRGDWMFLTPRNGSGNMEFATGTTYNWNKQSITAPALSVNQWVHVAITFTNRLATMYINGVAVGSNANMDFQPYHINGGMPNTWIGRSQYTSDPYLNGKIDDFRIYNGALSASQVYAIATGNSAPTPPSAPSSLSATAVPGNRINLSWPTVSGATSYSIYRASSGSGPFTPIATLVIGTTYSDTGLPAALATGTPYFYRVAAANAGGDSAAFAAASANAIPLVPGAPFNLTLKSPTSTSALLTWIGNANAATYTVRRATVAGGPYTVVASGLTAPIYSDMTLTTGTTYFYVVTSVNAAGEGAYSNEGNVTPSDLAVQLKFDEGVGTTAYDATGNNWSGTLLNGPAWSSSGKINGGVTLDGTDDYISLPTGVVNGLTSITISAWVNIATVATWQRIFDFGTGTSNYMFLSPKNGANSKVRFAITTTGGSGEQIIDGTATLPTGAWTHVAVTINGVVGTLYVNGVQVGQKTNMTINPSSLGNTTQNYLGKSQFSDPYFNGKVDDFRIYNRALSSAQINSLVNVTRPTTPANLIATGGIGQASLTWSSVAGATSYSIFRSTSASGPFVPAAAHVGVSSFVDTGPVADATAGTTYYYVVVAENAGGDSPYSTTASTLVKPSLPDAPQGVSATAGNSGAIKLAWTLDSNVTSYSIGRSLNADGPFTTIASNVTAAAFTDTGLINGINYYYTVTATNLTGTGPASDLAAATASDLLARLKFDNSAADATGHGYDGTLVNTPTWTSSGKIDSAISLSGASQYVALPTGLVSGLTTATFATWVYLNSGTSNQRIFDFGSGTGTNMFLTNAGGTFVRFAITTSGNGGEQSILGTAAIPTGNWVHVAVTLNGSVGTLYVNGTQVGQKTNMTLTPSSLGNTTQNWLGRSQYAADSYLNGKLDDFRIYSRALSTSEIGKLFSATVPAIPTGIIVISGNAQVVLNWTAASNATSYTIFRTSDQSTFSPIAAGITSNTWTDSTVTNGVTYQYQIVAVNAYDSSLPSATVTGSPNGIPATIGGTSGVDNYYLRRSGSMLQVWLNGSGTGIPDYQADISAVPSLTFSGADGNDSLVMDFSNGDVGPITFNGGNGNDSMSIKGASSSDNIVINTAGQITRGSTSESYSNTETLSLATGNYAINTNLNGLNLQLSGAATTANLTKSQNLNTLTIDNGASVSSSNTHNLPAIVAASLNISNANLSIAPIGNTAGICIFSNVAISGNGKLDLTNNDLIIDYTSGTSSYDAARNLVQSGLQLLGGNGYGIGSSWVDSQTLEGTMLAVVDDGDPSIGGAISSLSGFTLPHPNTSIIIKFTWFGDSNLDGTVDGSDYALLDSGFTSGGSLTGWVFGDYDYSDIVDGSDYALIDTGFISQNSIL